MAATSSQYVLAIDAGTTSTRVLIFSASGAVVSLSQRPHASLYPAPSYVEQSAEEIWENTAACITDAMREAKCTVEQISAVGITNQRETVVVWDSRSGKPLYNALVWQDNRGESRVRQLNAGEGFTKQAGDSTGMDAVRRWRHKTGLPLSPYFSATKLEWLQHHFNSLEEGNPVNEHTCMGTLDAYLCFKLTGRHVTDVTNASRTYLFDIHALEWDDELCNLFSVPKTALPRVQPSVSDFGACLPCTPLPGARVTAILGDQQAALFGQACFHPGEAKNTYGTGLFLLMNTGTTPVESTHGLLTTIAYQIKDEPPIYALEVSQHPNSLIPLMHLFCCSRGPYV